MNIVLEFDYYTKVIYIPEGYIQDIKAVQMNFFDWIYEKQECLIRDKKILCLSYNEQDFLRYINEVILIDSREKAYIVTDIKRKIKGKLKRLKF